MATDPNVVVIGGSLGVAIVAALAFRSARRRVAAVVAMAAKAHEAGRRIAARVPVDALHVRSGRVLERAA